MKRSKFQKTCAVQEIIGRWHGRQQDDFSRNQTSSCMSVTPTGLIRLHLSNSSPRHNLASWHGPLSRMIAGDLVRIQGIIKAQKYVDGVLRLMAFPFFLSTQVSLPAG
ncbi:hypothetical protein TNCV_2712981 [Trichonephila clavipes]|nr:hypothetical protein TNCV_2712981 [Trichonephila clavipes]